MKYDFYDKERLYKPSFAGKCRDRLHRKVLKGLNVLSICDIGIGFGELARYCRKNNIKWVGIEPNEKLRETMIEEGFTVYNGMMPQFPDIEEKFDAIVASHIIEHLNNAQEALHFLVNCRKMLLDRGGRYLIILYPDIEKVGFLFYQDYTHSFITTKKRIEDMLYDTEWKIVSSRRYTACFFLFSGLISFIGKFFPYFLLPQKIAWFLRLSFQQHCVTIAEPVN